MRRLLFSALLIVAGCQQEAVGLREVDLRASSDATLMAVETAQPQFSWRMESSGTDGSQRAYAIELFPEIVASLLASGEVRGARPVIDAEPLQDPSSMQGSRRLFELGPGRYAFNVTGPRN